MAILPRVALGLVLLACATQAAAQAVPPIGRWAGANGKQLVVNDNATCAYITASDRVEGSCSWQQLGAADGVLAIDYQTTALSAPQRMYVSVHWINWSAIVVLGEQFRRQ